MIILHTKRLVLREFTFDDDGFILELLNDPGFLLNIGDKGVRTPSEARAYLEKGPMESYRCNGFGLYAVEAHDSGAAGPIGMCGLVKRDGLQHPDIGYAFLARHRGRGYAVESAAAVLDLGTRVLKLPRIVAITSPDNEASIRVLEKIGFKFDRLIDIKEGDCKLFVQVPAVF